MSDADWEDAYRAAWKAYYAPDHLRTILRRVAKNRSAMLNSITSTLLWFNTMIPLEGIHPLEGGMIRMKHRRDRRPDLPIESILTFYPKLARDMAHKLRGYWSTWRLLRKTLKEVRADPDRMSYTDIAISPLCESENEALDLFHVTRGGEAALARKRREEAIRAETARLPLTVAVE